VPGLIPEEPGASEQNFTIPTVCFADVGGIEHVLQDIREHIEYPLLHPEIYSHIGIGPPRYATGKENW
jgi:ATP-dependent 26S proteasome regulatory subunit